MASAACRRPIASPRRRARDLAPAAAIPAEKTAPRLTAGQIARDLEELCAMGLVEKFKDEHNITRYRPTNGRIV